MSIGVSVCRLSEWRLLHTFTPSPPHPVTPTSRHSHTASLRHVRSSRRDEVGRHRPAARLIRPTISSSAPDPITRTPTASREGPGKRATSPLSTPPAVTTGPSDVRATPAASSAAGTALSQAGDLSNEAGTRTTASLARRSAMGAAGIAAGHAPRSAGTAFSAAGDPRPLHVDAPCAGNETWSFCPHAPL